MEKARIQNKSRAADLSLTRWLVSGRHREHRHSAT
jgi:hypothetical protein